MAFYPFNPAASDLAKLQREGLDDLRSARYKLAHVNANLAEMTDAQAATAFGYADSTVAGNAKAEIASAVGNLLSTSSGINMATTQAAVVQMLSRFG